ncbi:aminotransferase class I/II-fold pyridoxal phosphate-dependent enzyme [Thermus filiformis]|uniref:Aminotransferase n=1 Tax=Thermus filiformis TaxID=276 RepID=A0A0A2WR43_THEFI|nr:aminotransferase class I/II-fold pyridoxal phosphate-dependent enzyme [Thermus filiformis]KGQ21207.1 succinyldiaminopimelate aminotransferase [Thermus filiformis]
MSSRVPPPSVFLEMDRAKREAKEKGLPLLDLSIGSTDLPPPKAPLEALQEALADPSTYGYCLKTCTLPFLKRAVAWFRERFGLELDPASEALALIGSQEGLAHLLLALTEPGETLLLPEVAYPSYLGAARVASLRVQFIPLGEDLLPDLTQIPSEALRQARVLLLNYPNNPTGRVAPRAFLEEALAFAEAHGLWLVHDNPYVDQVFEGQAESALALAGKGARVVELFSLSKSYNLAGFRLGFALGHREAIRALEAVKGVVDFNQYAGILRMGVAALNTPREVLRSYAKTYARRAQALYEALKEALWMRPPEGTMYLWGRLPKGVDDLAFAQRLALSTGLILAPGQGFGPGGRGYVRLALVRPEEDLFRAAQILKTFLEAYD